MRECYAELIRIKEELESEINQRKTETVKLEQRLECIIDILDQLQKKTGEATGHQTHRMVIRNKWGSAIAHMDVSSIAIDITPTDNTSLDITKPPFRSFFLYQILNEMKKEDKETVREGKLTEGDALTYNYQAKKHMLIFLRIENYRTKERLQRIKEALTWTLKKIHKKQLKSA